MVSVPRTPTPGARRRPDLTDAHRARPRPRASSSGCRSRSWSATTPIPRPRRAPRSRSSSARSISPRLGLDHLPGQGDQSPAADTPIRKDITQTPATGRSTWRPAPRSTCGPGCTVTGTCWMATATSPTASTRSRRLRRPEHHRPALRGLFWRIAKGGPDLAKEDPLDSAMPAWEDRRTEEQIWQLTYYLYAAAATRLRRRRTVGGQLSGRWPRPRTPPPASPSTKRCAGCHGRDGPAASSAAPAPRFHGREAPSRVHRGSLPLESHPPAHDLRRDARTSDAGWGAFCGQGPPGPGRPTSRRWPRPTPGPRSSR